MINWKRYLGGGITLAILGAIGYYFSNIITFDHTLNN